MMRATVTSCAVLALAAAPAVADPLFKITEAYVGISGQDGSPDWIEVTNFGDMDGDTGVLFYDDESQDIGLAGQLPSFLLSPGESAVVMVTDDVGPTSVDEFTAIWGAIPNVGIVSDPFGGGLSQGGDTATIMLGDGTIVDDFVYAAGPTNSTLEDVTGMGTPVESVAGVNGAYVSNPFFNDSIGDPIESMLTLTGSPGRIPEPTAALLVFAGVMGLSALRSRG